MDYNSIHGPGRSNFSPSPHRMPTVSAAQALQDLKSSPTRCISTGLPLFDCALQNREPVSGNEEPFYGGVSRGKVTEIYGPPGVGKTTIGIQLSANALKAGGVVVWIDGSHQVSGHRLSQILSASSKNSSPPDHDQSHLQSLHENFTHFSTPTLSHLIAFLSEHSPSEPPANTSLIIIDSFSTLFENAYPRNADSNIQNKKPGESKSGSRKFSVLKSIINTIQNLAATRNIAIVILSPCKTKMRSGAGAVLVPDINSANWEQVLGCRVALFRDFGWKDEGGTSIQDVRFAQILKAEGVLVPDGRPRAIAFSIVGSGLTPITIPIDAIPTPRFKSPVKRSPHPLSRSENQHPTSTSELPILHPAPKRKLEDTGFEIPDSDEENYDWSDEDEEDLPPPPPQWQGTEDELDPAMEPEEEVDGVDRDKELDELADDPEALARGLAMVRQNSQEQESRRWRAFDKDQYLKAVAENTEDEKWHANEAMKRALLPPRDWTEDTVGRGTIEPEDYFDFDANGRVVPPKHESGDGRASATSGMDTRAQLEFHRKTEKVRQASQNLQDARMALQNDDTQEPSVLAGKVQIAERELTHAQAAFGGQDPESKRQTRRGGARQLVIDDSEDELA